MLPAQARTVSLDERFGLLVLALQNILGNAVAWNAILSVT